MFLLFSVVCGIATSLYLIKSIRDESLQKSVIERMNKVRDENDRALFTGDSRLPNE